MRPAMIFLLTFLLASCNLVDNKDMIARVDSVSYHLNKTAEVFLTPWL
ncbi:MAG: hypothetical protein GXO88_10045 [Chlorobi bacterium]|nr:hypothetical protein [Chlorobiota bacterium]